jgi:two-component system response regulator
MSEPVKILLVEDNPNDVELALHAFRKHRLSNSVQVARDGEEALDFLFCRGEWSDRDPSAGPRVILLDLKLPKIDGIEVLRQIKGNPATRAMPIIVLTSSSEEPDIEECYRLGVNSYIVKPVDFDQFSEAVAQLGFYWLLLNVAPKVKPDAT